MRGSRMLRLITASAQNCISVCKSDHHEITISVPSIATHVRVPEFHAPVSMLIRSLRTKIPAAIAVAQVLKEQLIEADVEWGIERGGRIDRPQDVRARSWNVVKSRTNESNCSEEDQADYDNDKNPGNCVCDDDAVPQLAIRRAVLFQYRSACVFCDHRVLPEKIFRDRRFVGGSRFGFLRSRGHLLTRNASMRTFAPKNYQASPSIQ